MCVTFSNIPSTCFPDSDLHIENDGNAIICDQLRPSVERRIMLGAIILVCCLWENKHYEC